VLRRKAFPTLSSPCSWRQVVNAAVVDDPRASVVASPVVSDCRRLPSGFRMHGHLPSTHRKVRRFTTTHAPLLSILLASASGEPLCISHSRLFALVRNQNQEGLAKQVKRKMFDCVLVEEEAASAMRGLDAAHPAV
jgi:hypothetical protein